MQGLVEKIVEKWDTHTHAKIETVAKWWKPAAAVALRLNNKRTLGSVKHQRFTGVDWNCPTTVTTRSRTEGKRMKIQAARPSIVYIDSSTEAAARRSSITNCSLKSLVFCLSRMVRMDAKFMCRGNQTAILLFHLPVLPSLALPPPSPTPPLLSPASSILLTSFPIIFPGNVVKLRSLSHPTSSVDFNPLSSLPYRLT